MKTRYLAILTMAVFLGFSVPAVAHDCDRHEDKSHKHCINDSGPDAVYFVEVEIWEPQATEPLWCLGMAERNLSVGLFGDSCEVQLDGMQFCLLAVGVKNTPNETGAQYVFVQPCGSNDGWNTDRLPAKVILTEPEGDFKITVDAPAETQLRKKSPPGKGVLTMEKIVVGEIIYTADPP